MHQAVVYSPEPQFQLKEDTGLETLAPLLIELASGFGSCFGLDLNHGGRRFSKSGLRSSLSRSRSLMSIARGLSLIKDEDETQLLERRQQTYTRSIGDLSKKELYERGIALREFKDKVYSKSSTHHGATQTAKEIVESLQDSYVKDEIGRECVRLSKLLEQNNLYRALFTLLDDPRLSRGIVGEYLSKSVVKSEKWPSHVNIEVYSLDKLPDAGKIISQIEAPVMYSPDPPEAYTPQLEYRTIRLVLVAGHYWVLTSTTPGSNESRLRYVLGDGHCLWHAIAEGLADAYAHDQAVEESRSGQNPLSVRKGIKKHRHVPANWDNGLANVLSKVLHRREELCRVMPKSLQDCHKEDSSTFKAAVCNLVSAWKNAGSYLRNLASSPEALTPILIPIDEDAENFIDALRQPQEVSQVPERMSADRRRELEEDIRAAQNKEQEQTLIDAITTLMKTFGLSGSSENSEPSSTQYTLEELSTDEYPWQNFWESNTSSWEQIVGHIRSRLRALASL